MADLDLPPLKVVEEPVAAGEEALTVTFTTGLLALPRAELKLFSSPLDLIAHEVLPREGKRFPLPPGTYGIRLKARLGPAAKEVVTLPPGRHLRVEVDLAEVWRLHTEETAGSFNRAFQTFDMEQRADGWDGPPF